ncbi:hypothetical protein [Microvirga roseola]|uniref:hypothetical protein n=1 Tax=Microvirga roseola TaxID=2883126 RepID=UPI001E2AD568|nr:hypothetical protein [Microvirga roseola]
MNTPKTDDFRLERRGDKLVVVFTPTGREYAYTLQDGGQLSKPDVSPPQAAVGDYAEDDLRRTADELARLAVSGAPD